MNAAFDEVRPPAHDSRERAASALASLGFIYASLLVERMTPEEWHIWTENRELPPWVNGHMRLR